MKTFTAFCLAWSLHVVFAFSQNQIPISTEVEVRTLTLSQLTFREQGLEEYRVGLKKYGFTNSGYSVLAQGYTAEDLVYRLLPVEFQNGQSVGCIFKKGNRRLGNSLIIYRRAGSGDFTLKNLKIWVARGNNFKGFILPDTQLAYMLLGRMGYTSAHFKP